jgi:hypothetical protein
MGKDRVLYSHGIQAYVDDQNEDNPRHRFSLAEQFLRNFRQGGERRPDLAVAMEAVAVTASG